MGDLNGLTAVSSSKLLVGVSVSEPSEDELIPLGLSELHIRHAFIEIVRHILAADWSVAYGGDLRPRGYTQALIDLVRTYERTTLSGPEHVTCYLAWPGWMDLTDADRAELANIASVVRVPAPSDAPGYLPSLSEQNPNERLWNALALRAMRERMATDLGAAVVVGGRVAGQQGLLPGVIEEAVTALSLRVPLFVAGGFGGCGRLIARALDGEKPDELSVDFQSAHTDHYSDLFEAAARAGTAPNYTELLSDFSSRGVSGLGNGLGEHENRRLLSTDDIDELIALVLRGLFKIARRTR